MKQADRQVEIGKSVFREANDAFFLFDPRSQAILDVNPAALRISGLEKDAACALCLEQVFFGSEPGALELFQWDLSSATDDVLAVKHFYHRSCAAVPGGRYMGYVG